MRFADWLIRTGTTDAAFAVRAGKSRETVRRWKAGEREPDSEAMAQIFDLTDGQVTPNDWVGVGPRSATSAETSPS